MRACGWCRIDPAEAHPLCAEFPSGRLHGAGEEEVGVEADAEPRWPSGHDHRRGRSTQEFQVVYAGALEVVVGMVDMSYVFMVSPFIR